MTKKQTEQREAVERLKEWGLLPGTKVYGSVTHVSSSGMSRNIKLTIAVATDDGECGIRDISWLSARAMGWPYVDKYNGGVRVGGCGMNMILHTVDVLSYAMGYGGTNQNREAGDLPGLRGNY
jgi:hypothetical protein